MLRRRSRKRKRILRKSLKKKKLNLFAKNRSLLKNF